MSVQCVVFIEGDEQTPRPLDFISTPQLGELTKLPTRHFTYEVVKVLHVPRDVGETSPGPHVQVTVRRRD